MQKVLLLIDKINGWIGKFFAWSVLVLTLFVSYEVFSRYAFGQPHAWSFDVMNMLYGALFMMAGAYTLSQNGHVRGDVLYGFFPVRLQASIDLTLYIAFFIPGVVAMAWAGFNYAGESWMINEHSTITANGPPIYPFKAIIPFAGVCLLVQGFAEIARCVMCLKNNKWPSRQEDVEEVDVDKLRAMVNVDEAELKELDHLITSKNGSHA